MKGLVVDYYWENAEILYPSIPIADDLMDQAKADMETFITDGTKPNLIKSGSESYPAFVPWVYVTDLIRYPTWSEWGSFSPCNDDTCSRTKKMKCVDSDYPGTQILCAEPNSVPTHTETCTSDKCGKYSDQIFDVDVDDE